MSKSILNQIISLCDAEKYDEALEILNSVDLRKTENPYLLVCKSRCLQLSDNGPLDALKQAELCLENALEIDADYLPALIDLAYFYSRVMGNSKKGKELFEEAVQLSEKNYVESIVGLVECEEELVSNQSALELLSKYEARKLESSTIDKLKADLNF